MKVIDNHIYAERGMVLRRISSGEIFGNELDLGYSHYIGGVLQVPPHLDVPEDFEDIEEEYQEPMPEENEIPSL